MNRDSMILLEFETVYSPSTIAIIALWADISNDVAIDFILTIARSIHHSAPRYHESTETYRNENLLFAVEEFSRVVKMEDEE